MQPSNTYTRPTGTPQGKPVDSSRLAGRGLAAKQPMSTVQENIEESIDEDFGQDDFDDSTDKITKADILKREADKKTVRDHEQKVAKAGRTVDAVDATGEVFTISESAAQLNNLWKRVRDFLADVDEIGNKIELRKGQDPARIRFMNACDRYADPKSTQNNLPFEKVKTAFNSAYLLPLPSDQEFKRLFRSLEAYYNEELQIVQWSKILDGMAHREHLSVAGIFPRIIVRGTLGADKQVEYEKQAESQKEIARLEEEAQKRAEAKEKQLDKLRKQDVFQSKSGVTTKPGSKPTGPSKEELKKQEREALLQKEEERQLKIEQQKVETAAVKRESEAFSRRLNAIIGKFRESGTATQIINTFKMYDKDGNGKLDLKEFTKGMLQCKIHVNPDEIAYVYGAIDEDSSGQISYKEFSDVVFGIRKVDVQKYIAERRHSMGLDSGIDPKVTAQLARVSMDPNFESNEYRSAGSVGLSSIMKRSENDNKTVNKFVDETEAFRNFTEIKDLFHDKFFSFEELLQTMIATTRPGYETKLQLKDFERAVIASCKTSQFSAFQIKSVFMMQAINTEQGPDKAYIPLRDFKDLFYPARAWKGEYNSGKNAPTPSLNNLKKKNDEGEEVDEAWSEASMLIDDIMQGKAIDDIMQERNQAERKALVEEELKRQANVSNSIKDDFETQSNYSERIDQIIAVKTGDPRHIKGAKIPEPVDKPFVIPNKKLKAQVVKTEEVKGAQFGNESYYKQPDLKNAKLGPHQVRLLDTKSFDHAVDKILVKFVENLLGDLYTAGGKAQPDYGSYVDRYGKEFPGFLTFNEIKEMYMAHVHFTEMTVRQQAPPDDNLIRALYNTISQDQRNKIAKDDFSKFLMTKEPPSFLHRLQMKIRRGAGRLSHALQEECQEADILFGANGLIPLPAFQTIMNDYDLPIISTDKDILKEQGFIKQDSNMNDLVLYKQILGKVAPKEKQDMDKYADVIIRTQKIIRGFLARRQYARMMRDQDDSQLNNVKDQVQSLLGKKGGKAGTKEPEPAKKDEKPKGKMTKEELLKKKEVAAKAQRQGRRDQFTMDKKMAQVVKPVRDSKAAERAARQKQEIADFIKDSIIEQMITKAYCYGESLEVCRTIQQKYENRPVTKFVYPLLQQFQFSSQGVSSKSLQPFNALGQVMFLNAQNQLQQYDIATNKTLAPVSLGTRPPLKHYNIIDMVVDQRSGRIYTINSNWILEIWNIEQNAQFPQKRIAVCSNEGGKDFVSLYYENTFNDAKPRFLCLQESNQQVLVVNTTCVDGSIVFIDPISFSILKKIQLRYVDYELPLKVRQSIKQLSLVFDRIKQEKGKDIVTIFSKLINLETQEVGIRALVDHLFDLDKTLTREELFSTVIALDEDGSGNISLDEFLNYFGQVDLNEDDDFHRAQEEQLLQDEMWPRWVLDEQKLGQIQTILQAMYTALEKNHGITPEAAFGIYDMSDNGYCSQVEFKRIAKIFFGDDVPEGPKLDFIMRLTVQTVDGKIRYREFCKFLSKRFVKTFKLATKVSEEDQEEDNTRQKSAQEIELERPTVKEASLSYILRKAAELQIDIRREFQSHDPLELSVISRVNFWGVLLSLPLGLNEDELTEIFDSDLNYDNNGNVDYVSIINSDIFVLLERKRLTAQALQNQQSRRKTVKSQEVTDQAPKPQEAANSDNRKVVVEDLIFIDDLEIIIYTTVRPRTSTIFITSMCKSPKPQAKDSSSLQIVELAKLDPDNVHESILQSKMAALENGKQADDTVVQASYPLIARLRGHKNDGAPSVCYIPQSNCLVSAEKHTQGNGMPQDINNLPKNDDPNEPISHKVSGGSKTGYKQYTQRHEKNNMKCEILIWNLQRDMIELFSTNYPWNVPAHKKWVAHDASIIDICYLTKSQLLVTSAMDQTIRFWDPVQTSYELTDPSNNPHAQMKPGYYKPLKPEQTRSNATFKEVKRVYCGNDTNCFALRTLCISNVILNAQQPSVKSQIEWLICLKNPLQNSINKEQLKKNRVGIVCGYGIERVKIEIPAKHLDDIVPPYVMKECEELVEQRRRKIVTAFQKQLPISIEKIYSQTQLQNSYMDKIRGLFMQAILNRKDGQFVNPIPLREVYQVLLKLPARTKFEFFLASSGCSDKLSVSETFFYLQKFMQIHPLRTTQIEFEKSIEDFYNRHQRQFLQGVKRWPIASIQKFANYIRQSGLDISFLQEPAKQNGTQVTTASFCTRERFIEYFLFINSNPPHVHFQDDEIENIMSELDPYQTGAIQINLVERYFREEIEFNKLVALKRPQEIIQNIRNVAFPNKKIALQQSLAAADEQGDGYITKLQFIDAMLRADIKIERDQFELLFDVMSERFDQPKNQEDDLVAEVRHLNLPFFYSKLFTKSEVQAISEVDQTLQHIKAALIYKGVDFGIVFAEQQSDDKNQTKNRKAAGPRKTKTDTKIDLMCHYSRFAQQIVKQEFCERVTQLNAVSITPDKIMRLANYLSLNQKNQSVIYLNTWMHHLRRINTQFQVPDRAVLPIICSKLLKNESVFRSLVESIGLLKQKREEEKFCEQADLRQVLKKFGISYINQGMFLQEFTKGSSVHLQDLIARMKSCVKSHYNTAVGDLNETRSGSEAPKQMTLQELRKTDYFDNVQKRIKKSKQEISIGQLLTKMQEFDESDTGLIHAYKLVNILKHQLPGLFDEQTLIGLQYELECLSYEHLVDYSEFIKIFLQAGTTGRKLNVVAEIKLDMKKSTYTLNEYEDLLGRISEHVRTQGLDLLHIFEIFCKKSGFISYSDLRKIVDLIDFPITEKQFELLTMYADEEGQQNVHAYDLAQQIENAEVVAPQFDIQKWIIASRELQGRHNLLALVYDSLPMIKEQIHIEFSEGKPGYEPNVLTGQQFQQIVRKEVPSMSEHDVDLLTIYSIKGSRRAPQNGEMSNPPIQIQSDLVQFAHFEKALNEVVNDMRKAEIQRKQKEQAMLVSEVPQTESKPVAHTPQTNTDFQKRESQLISKVTQLFREREVSFFDAFQQYFDPLAEKNVIPVKMFKELVNKLNLPLTVQDQRILRRIADPNGIGKVELKNFCSRFETQDLRMIRLNQTLDKIATSFYIQNFNLKKAFQLFDVNGDGVISKEELRQGFATLEIGIKYDEINDLMRLITTTKDGKISYDNFITKMDANIRHRRSSLSHLVEDQVFKKIADCISHSGESLYEAMKIYDTTNQGQIQARDLTRVFKRLGLQSIEPHLPLVLKAGGVRLQDNVVEISDFCQKFMDEVGKRTKQSGLIRVQTINKLHSLLQSTKTSMFEFFAKLDTNSGGTISKLELRTGIQTMNLSLNREEFEMLWSMLYKPKTKVNMQQPGDRLKKDALRPKEPEITYYDLIQGFVQSGAIKFNKSTDRADILQAKFRQQMKRLNYSVEKLYKAYDPKDLRYVFKNDFIDTSMLLGLEFSEDELVKIFETFCRHGEKESAQKQTQTRFNFKQMHDSLLVQRDQNWIYTAYIKIHSVVLQKGLTYKRLFIQWKTGKQQVGKLGAQEIAAGLKKLKAGLTQDEVDKLVAQLKYEGKEHVISDRDFEHTVIAGAQKLEQEQSYERMLLADWIAQFNEQMERNFAPIDNLFAEYDSAQEGNMTFDDFAKMNEASGVNINRKDLHRIFDLIDRQKNGKVRLEDIKNLAKFMLLQDEENSKEVSQDWVIEEEGLKGNDILARQKINDIYEELKTKIETKNVTLEQIMFTDLKFEQNSLATTQGVRNTLEKLNIILSTAEAEQILKDVRKHNYGKFECTYKNLVDFMTKKRINVAFVEKGFIDPLLANTVQALNRVKDAYDFTYEQIFKVLDAEEKGHFSKESFMMCLQGMNLGCAVEDIIELFNYMDDQNLNRITQPQFVNAMTFINQRMGGPSVLEQSMSKGLIQAKKGVNNMQLVFSILKKICEAVERRRLTIKQLSSAMDINKTGYLSRAEFVTVIHNLSESITLDSLRVVMQFLDDKSTGRISVFEFLRVVLEILNQQIGGGLYAFMQVQPIIQKVINELSIDCDKFFDEVADLNQAWMDQQAKDNLFGVHFQFKQVGLMKSIFVQTLSKYGVTLSEKENALISSVFGLSRQDRDKLDYAKLDAAFEGVQQQLYAQESQYTVEWERRIFKQIGDYLMRLNISIHQCFSMIDTDDSQTISMSELQNALIRFDLGLTNKQTKVFLARLDTQNVGYITQSEFIQRFWSAYTYDDVFGDEATENDPNSLSAVQMPHVQTMSSHNIIAANQRMKSELDQKVQAFRMFKAVQKRLIETMNIQAAFVCLDTNKVGFLTLRDFQINLSKHFNLSLKAMEVRALFQEIDSDENGIIKYAELDIYYSCDYTEKVKGVQKERQDRFAQNEIFDHLIKVLKQRGLTLQQVFEEIDDDKNNYIEVDEFHDMLERMGFTIQQEQVFELMKTMDENFDGRISYNEMRTHFQKLGFQISELEGDDNHDGQQNGKKRQVQKSVEHRWRDKALELIIRTSKTKIKGKTLLEYFTQYDKDHDGHLSPIEFRNACADFKEPMLKSTQIERILHIVLEERKLQPLASIDRICRLLSNYKYIQLNDGTPGNTAVLIDEDLFVYIVEKYDGISRMMEFVGNLEDKASYLQRHTYELGMRGLNMMSNQMQVLKLSKKSETLSDLYQSTLVLLAGDITRLMKEEAVLTVLDPTKNIDTIISDDNVGVLSSVSLPTIENSQFDVDYQSLTILPCGAQRYSGVLMATKEPIEILLYPSENLQYVSLDGKAYKRHLATELQIHRYLMGARFEEDDEMQNPDAFDDANLDIFANIGKFEKKIGLSVNDKEIYVVNKQISEDHWINLDDFVTQNGGILNIPLFYHTDAPLYIIRHWAKLLLKIIAKVHDVSVVLRSLSTKQLWISRDGQRIRLGHVRGSGRVNNLGFLKSCPDIYLNLDNNERNARDDNKSTGFSPSKGGGLQSSRRTNDNSGQKVFSNRALDSAFIAPEVLFSKFSDHTAAIDVWAFGMIMFSLIFGRKPVSYYQIYRQWLLKSHQTDVEMGNLPFTPPSHSNFIYDPFSIDFENPFESISMEDLAQNNFKQKMTLEEMENQFRPKDGTLNFENFMKCISDLSYSGMFTKENSKKFSFDRIVQKEASTENNTSMSGEKVPIRFAGQQNQQQSVRKQFLIAMAKEQVLERKNELGLILDLMSACLDCDPKKRPTIQGLLHSPIFQLDAHEKTNAVRFSQNVILYRSPSSSVSQAITAPLRAICAEALKAPMGVYDHIDTILKLFVRVEDAIQFQTSLPLDELNQVMTESEKRKGITAHMASKGVDASKLRVAPNSPLAAQVIEDKVIDMLLFLTFRFIKHFSVWKQRQINEMDMRIQMVNQQDVPVHSHGTQSQAASNTNKTTKSKASSVAINQHEEVKKNVQRLENQVLQKMTHLLKTIVYQMHSYNTPMAPHVGEVIAFVVKFFIGEEHFFGSDVVLSKTCQHQSSQQLKAFLRDRSFFRRESELDANYKSDQADKLWHLEQKNKTFLDKSNYWCPELYSESLKIYRDAITESGRGQSCYPVICDYITSVTNSFEPTKIFSKQMSHLSMSFLIPMNRTSAYYNELIPIAESLSRLYNPDLEKAGKRCSLAMVRSVFQTGNSDKIKACLDMRVPKHLVHFIQDSDQEVRKECLYTYLEISKGLQDDDFEVIGKHAANLKREFSKQGYTKTAFDLHKAISMASQSEVLDAQAKIDKINATNRRGGQVRQQSQAAESISSTEAQCNYIKRTIALIEKNENEKYINFALDLPNLNFLASKRFLKEMAVCFESPVFIAPLVRLLKTPTELHPNKVIVLDIFKNLVCGNEKVLIALNSPACDTYMTLLKILMMNTKMANARQNPSSQGTSTQMKLTLSLQDKTVELFQYMFEQRRPTIIRDISCIGASSTLLKEQDLHIPLFISLPDIVAFFDDFAAEYVINPAMINVNDFISHIKDLRCWVKHFFAVSTIPELTKIKAMQRCMNLLIRVLKVVWREYYRTGYTEEGYPPCTADLKIDYMLLIRTTLSFFDWLCINQKFQFLFNEEAGRTNLAFIINTCNMILCQFRKPLASTTDTLETAMPPMEDLTFNDRNNKVVQDKRRYDIFPFTDIGSILQNIQYQLVRKNDPFLNQLLSEANFGFVFGEQLLLEYDFIRHCIDNCVESLVLMDSYVKKNEIRLNTFEFILRSSEDTIKDQLIKSNFCERIFLDYVRDFREFNIQFSKIDLEFLAFRRSYPLRLEAISLINTALMLRNLAPQIYTEFLMYSRRHLLIRQELAMLSTCMAVNSKEATCLLLFAVLLESNETDLVYVMVQEGAHRVIRTLMQEQPSLNKRFPILKEFINKF